MSSMAWRVAEQRGRRCLGGLLAWAALSLVAMASPLAAQTRPAFFDQPSVIEPLGVVPSGARVPLFILFPPTGGDARAVTPPPSLGPAFVMITPGAPQSSDYLPAFSRYLDWLDERVTTDLDRALAAHPIDPERVYLVGFSLGGDVSWALLLRHPDRFRGALVLGSRASATPRGDALTTLRTRRARVVVGMGQSDDATRQRGAERALERLRTGNVSAESVSYPGGHQRPDASTFEAALQALVRDATAGAPTSPPPPAASGTSTPSAAPTPSGRTSARRRSSRGRGSAQQPPPERANVLPR